MWFSGSEIPQIYTPEGSKPIYKSKRSENGCNWCLWLGDIQKNLQTLYWLEVCMKSNQTLRCHPPNYRTKQPFLPLHGQKTEDLFSNDGTIQNPHAGTSGTDERRVKCRIENRRTHYYKNRKKCSGKLLVKTYSFQINTSDIVCRFNIISNK